MLNSFFKALVNAERDETACSQPDEKDWETMVVERSKEIGIDPSKKEMMCKILLGVANLNEGVERGDQSMVESASGDITIALCILSNGYGLSYEDCCWTGYGQMSSEGWSGNQ